MLHNNDLKTQTAAVVKFTKQKKTLELSDQRILSYFCVGLIFTFVFSSDDVFLLLSVHKRWLYDRAGSTTSHYYGWKAGRE